MQLQKQFFSTGKTQDISWRIKQLKKLKCCIIKHADDVLDALHKDLSKPAFEAYTSEVYQVLDEINYFLKHISCLNTIRRKSTPLHLWPAKSYVMPTPYGSVLIMAPWNFPFQLNMIPLVGALAAGNCAVIKPSEFAPHTAAIIQKIIELCFMPEYVKVKQGGVEIAQQLLDQPFDYIFFTGSTRVGKIVMQKAAEQLIPLTLELGGKNPCIVDGTGSLDTAAKRIAWGAFYNAGQNCVSPDYVLVNEQCKDELIEKIIHYITQFYPAYAYPGLQARQATADKWQNYARIINTKHVQRLENLMQGADIVYGGTIDQEGCCIEPTLIDNVLLNDPIMQEELFGPLLPILTYKKLDDAIAIIHKLPKPLALYLFSNDRCTQQKIIKQSHSGGMCINDVLVQAASAQLPFGGVGASGFGRYHGKYSFETFSYQRAILKKSSIELPIRYAPYKRLSRLLIRFLQWWAR